MTWLPNSFEEFSLMWLLLSSILGGVVGASVSFLFEVILPGRIQQRREALNIKRKYTTPILLSAVKLRGRLANMIKRIDTIEKELWLSPTEGQLEAYYYISTLYVTSDFLGWYQILRNTVVYLDWTTTKETKKFEQFLTLIERAFTDPGLLGVDTSASHPHESKDKWVFSFWLQAIGSLMIEDKDDSPKTMDYLTFQRSFADAKEETEFVIWLNRLGTLFADLKKEERRFRRIVAIHAILTAFIDYIDPKHLRTTEEAPYWDLLHDYEQVALKNEIAKINKR